MSINFKKYIFCLLIPIVFFLASFFTLSDYGISWDEPIHFVRGQAYLNYFLTGDLTYQDTSPSIRRSHYQETSFTAKYFLKNDSGHPPLNGILAALSNYIFYQRLGVLGDIESFHLFNMLAATLLVFIVTIFATQAYGRWAGIVAGITLSVYPLFFAESHFNIKDPAEAAFIAATIWSFWNSLKRYDSKWLLTAILFFTLGLGTKFNILFLPVIIVPWLIVRYAKTTDNPFVSITKLPRNFLILLGAAPFVVTALFFISWPYLWQNPIANTLNIFLYYKEIGTGGLGQPQFITWGGFNLFPITWILITTPPVILLFTLLGIFEVFSKHSKKEKTTLLWLIWLVIPIMRVSLPGSSIYGGIRQIMEFLPAMALLSGLGGYSLFNMLKSFFLFKPFPKVMLPVALLMFFIPHMAILAKMHPNENVYFNFLIGGLKGAKQANIPYWGNSFGNAYYQAANWLNKNAAPGSRVGLVQGTSVNIPPAYFSPTFNYSNSSWSGINREGEYLVELTHQGNEVAYPFAWQYIKTVLIPVFEVQVDGVAIAKVWKNDIDHSKDEYKLEKGLIVKGINKKQDAVEIELGKIYSLAKLNARFNKEGDCEDFQSGIIQTSINGREWGTEFEKISDWQVRAHPSLENGVVRYIFPATKAKYIKIKTYKEKSCFFQNLEIDIIGFE